jgi:hypothetical protein
MTNAVRDRIFNISTYVVLVATLCLVIYYALVGFNVGDVNPYPPSTSTPRPTGTPTPTPPIATWTPTNTPTVTPTPGPTDTRTPTLTPSVTPTPLAPFTALPTFTFPPTNTPTPRVTRAALPFVCEVDYRVPEYGLWTGVAGHIEDLDGEPLPGYYAVVEGPGNPPAIQAGRDARINSVYGNEAAWEHSFNPTTYQAMDVKVQLCKPNPDPDQPCIVISNQIDIKLGGYASSSLGYVTCVKNWEEYE